MAYRNKTDKAQDEDSDLAAEKPSRYEKPRAKPSTWQAAEITKFVLEHETNRSAEQFVTVMLRIADGLAECDRRLERK